MIDQLRKMAIFAKTIDHGSFRGAASELQLSPSVISHHVSELEEQLGVALIYRSTRKLTLTKEGERVLNATRKMLEAVEGELSEISGTSGEPSGELRITVPSVLSQFSLTNDIANFLKKFNKIKISLDYSDTTKELIDDGFDIAIRMWLSEKKSTTTKLLYKVGRKLVASRKYLEKNLHVDTPQELQNLEWLVLSPVHNKGIFFTNKKNDRVKIKPDARIFSNDAQSLYKLVQSNLGFAALPNFLVDKEIASGKIQHILPDWKLDSLSVFAEWPTNAPRKGLIKLFVSELTK